MRLEEYGKWTAGFVVGQGWEWVPGHLSFIKCYRKCFAQYHHLYNDDTLYSCYNCFYEEVK